VSVVQDAGRHGQARGMMAATVRGDESDAVPPRLLGRPSHRLGRRATVLVTAVATASLAVTGYPGALAVIDGVSGWHRPPPDNGIVSGITSLVSSRAFAAALSSASNVAASQDAGSDARPASTGASRGPVGSGPRSRSRVLRQVRPGRVQHRLVQQRCRDKQPAAERQRGDAHHPERPDPCSTGHAR
jgi:hypothetical protein